MSNTVSLLQLLKWRNREQGKVHGELMGNLDLVLDIAIQKLETAEVTRGENVK